MTTTFDIERRLRLPAPDEPAVLPTLVLPTEGDLSRPRTMVRFRVPVAQPEGARLVYSVLALLLILAAIIAVGAVRLLESRPTLTSTCQGPEFAEAGCMTLELPAGWRQLSNVSLFPGDFTEVSSGIAYERVHLVVASVDLGTCASPGPPATPIPIASDAFELPRETPDVYLTCWRTAALPSNGIRVETLIGDRTSGLAASDGPALPDTSEPTVEAGWSEQVGGRPARLTVTAGSGRPGTAAETRTWDILIPGSIGRILRVRAEIAGPDVDAGRRSVQELVDSIAFQAQGTPLDPARADEVLGTTLDELDRGARDSRSNLYACFPRKPGRAEATISGGFYGPLAAPVNVSCSSAISPSRAGVWRIVLEVSWPASNDIEADTLRTEFFTTGADGSLNGGQVISLAGRLEPPEGADALFPPGSHQLPPLLNGPLDLPPGSIVEMLWPGYYLAFQPDPADEATAPFVVGAHLYVVSGPEILEGQDWYRVQWDLNGPLPEFGWSKGTLDGRPLLRIIEPLCPDAEADLSLASITSLISAERVVCFGDRTLTIEGGIFVQGEPQPQLADVCADELGNQFPCPTGLGDPDWLTRVTTWTLYGPDGVNGPDQPLLVWLDPAAGLPPTGTLVRIEGHFDDPGARGCEWPPIGSSGLDPVESPAIQELICRERFVVTGWEPATTQ